MKAVAQVPSLLKNTAKLALDHGCTPFLKVETFLPYRRMEAGTIRNLRMLTRLRKLQDSQRSFPVCPKGKTMQRFLHLLFLPRPF